MGISAWAPTLISYILLKGGLNPNFLHEIPPPNRRGKIPILGKITSVRPLKRNLLRSICKWCGHDLLVHTIQGPAVQRPAMEPAQEPELQKKKNLNLYEMPVPLLPAKTIWMQCIFNFVTLCVIIPNLQFFQVDIHIFWCQWFYYMYIYRMRRLCVKRVKQCTTLFSYRIYSHSDLQCGPLPLFSKAEVASNKMEHNSWHHFCSTARITVCEETGNAVGSCFPFCLRWLVLL